MARGPQLRLKVPDNNKYVFRRRLVSLDEQITGLAWGHPPIEKRIFCAAGGLPVTRLLTCVYFGNPIFFLAYLAQEVLLEVGDEGIFC